MNLTNTAGDIVNIKSGAICFDPNRLTKPDTDLFDAANPRLDAAPVKVGGRQSAWFISGTFGQAVLRHYRRGGMVAKLSRDQYIWTGASSTRSFAEFRILSYLRMQGLAVPAPLAAAYWRERLTYRAAILIERIPDVQPLAILLSEPQAVAKEIFTMHEAGIWHADLNAYNILLDSGGGAWLIDFDRAQHRRLTDALRRSNLFRLRRSLKKVAGERGVACWQHIYNAYTRLRG